MISRLTKIQLVIFAIVTLLGGAFVGGRYAKIDRMVVDRSYPVTVQLKDSGGLFEGAQVTYRGVGVGRVGNMAFKTSGVQARIDIENNAPKIPADLLAVVANKSAVGEQYMDLQPRRTTAPFLKSGTNITEVNTEIPIKTSDLLVNVNDLVKSVDTNSLKILVNELGTAFAGTGQDLGRIIDTQSEFIDAANENIGTTRALIRDSGSVLQTQIDKQGELTTFSKNLALFSDTLADSDPDLRRLADGGGGAAKEIREVVDENSEDVGALTNNLITANRPAFENTQAVRTLFILFPYLLEGAPSALVKNKDGTYDAAFGIVTGNDGPVCNQGYNDGANKRRGGADVEPRETRFDVDCTDSNKVARNPSKTVVNKNRASVAGYDSARGPSTPTDAAGSHTDPLAFGKESWQWLFLGPAIAK